MRTDRIIKDSINESKGTWGKGFYLLSDELKRNVVADRILLKISGVDWRAAFTPTTPLEELLISRLESISSLHIELIETMEKKGI